MERIDLLVVFNQDVSLASLARLIGSQRTVLLTSHSLFENEWARLREMCPNILRAHLFSELLSDAEMEDSDNQTIARMSGIDIRYWIPRFQDRMLYEKNLRAWEKLKTRYLVGVVHVFPGLGISRHFWKGNPPATVHETIDRFANVRVFLSRVTAKLSWIFRRIEVHLVRKDDVEYVFYGPVRRLQFVSGTLVTRMGSYALLKSFPGWIRERSRETDVVPSTTIHGFDARALTEVPNLHVFVDGFHPPNYTRSYVDSYGDPIFVTRSMFDDAWFRTHGKRTVKIPKLVKGAYMNPVEGSRALRRVVLLLNHGGDWSALINRSDTDLLIENFTLVASRFSGMEFIVRPHPTMARPGHEGKNSIDRIIEYVSWKNLPNLSVSRVEMKHDFDRGDLFVSEYSQTLIEAATLGKRILIANFTGRRSFMKCYEDVGFPVVESAEALADRINQIGNDPAAHDHLQNASVSRFNDLLDHYLRT